MRHENANGNDQFMRCSRRTLGFAATDLVVVLILVTVMLGIAMPTIARMRGFSGVGESLNNLTTMGAAHATYAADWNGRQVTQIVDEMSTYGPIAQIAFPNYEDAMGEPHPSIVLGWGIHLDPPVLFEFQYPMTYGSNQSLPPPMNFTGTLTYYGAFRLCNTRPFHDYVNGRFYDPVFYPPNDPTLFDIVEPVFDEPWEYVDEIMDTDYFGDIPAWASYIMSPAAMFDPEVMRHDDPSDPRANGWRDPWSVPDGHRSPSLTQALYPDLKTFMLEHHWNQSPPPDVCNPGFFPGTYNGCEPYYFNHGLASAPATLFYDLSARLLPNAEAIAADEAHDATAGYGLWSRDTPFGNDGYLSQFSYDATNTSHHILTTDGILGRDTLPGVGAMPLPRKTRPGPRPTR